MPQINAVIWNVRTFGSYPNYRQGSAVVNFIANYANAFDLNVIVFQEVRKVALPQAAALRVFLNMVTRRQWHFDAIPGAVVTNTARGALTAADLGFTQRSNYEGYMVFWEDGILAPLTSQLSYGIDGTHAPGPNDHYISLVVDGANPKGIQVGDPNRATVPPIVPIQPVVPGDGLFPGPNPAHIGTSFGAITPGVLEWRSIRRPCVIRTAGTHPTIIVAYHAPVSGMGPYYGALATGLGDWVQDAANFPNVIGGGDFNIIAPNELASGFDNFLFLDPRGVRTPNMAYGSMTVGGLSASMTRFTVNNQGWALLDPANPQDCYGNPRDVGFYRLGTATYQDSGVHDILEDLMGDANGLRSSIQDGRGRRIAAYIRQAINNGYLPPVVRNNAAVLQGLSDVFRSVGPTPFPDKLTAAIFYRWFISDHLPLFFNFTD